MGTTQKAKNPEFNYRNYTQARDGWSVIAILFNYVLIGGLAYLSYVHLHWLFYFPIAFFIAIRQNALIDALGHDATHFNLFSKKSWNRNTEFILFIPFLYSFEIYRKEHARHHSFLMDEKDPAFQNYRHWGILDENPNWLWIWYIRPFLLYDLPSIFQDLWLNLRTDPDFRWKTIAFWVPLLTASILLGFWPILLLYWVVPLLWLVPVIEYWTEVLDHFSMQSQADTRDSSGFFFRVILRGHNDSYHTLHHKYPRIPWFHLKQATRDYEKLHSLEKVSSLHEMYSLFPREQEKAEVAK